MNFDKACKILELDASNFSHSDFKKTYYRLALKYHPDKNPNDYSSTEKFREVNEAYKFLCEEQNINDYNIKEEPINLNFISLFNKFINVMTNTNIDVKTLITTFKSLNDGYQTISIKVFEELDKKTAINILDYVEQFSEVLGINEDIINSMKIIVKEKIKNDTLIILNPTLNNLLNEEVYELNYEGHTYFIPLWHDEITYDLSGQSIIVKCIPELPKHISIDENNNIHVNINISLENILERISIPIYLGEKEMHIFIKELKIKKTQLYIFNNCGIPIININNLFDNTKKSNIIIHIELIK